MGVVRPGKPFIEGHGDASLTMTCPPPAPPASIRGGRVATAAWLLHWSAAASAQSGNETSVRLNGVPVIRVTADGETSDTARASQIERRLGRLASPSPGNELKVIEVVPLSSGRIGGLLF